MTRKLLLKSSKVELYDDRDSFINKRVESPGELLKTLFKNNLNEMDLAMHNRCFIENCIRSVTCAEKSSVKQKTLE